MDQNPLKTSVPRVGVIGVLDAPVVNGGRMTFISKSEPYEKDGKKVCSVTQAINSGRQKVKIFCRKEGMTRKAFRKWLKENKRKERESVK